ncbi:MAG: TAT-variant-translocated molybdopterin oxidoreductase [Myxococcaceae bacterium]
MSTQKTQKKHSDGAAREALLSSSDTAKKPVHRKPMEFPLPVIHENPFAAEDSKEKGVVYWRSLQEKADSEEFRKRIETEFPMGAADMSDGVSRRSFLGVIGATVALAGAACTSSPREKIVAYTKNPEQVKAGVAHHYATATSFKGYGTGVLVTSWEGRPTKVEGNPDHPTSKGSSGTFDQASILGLYDPHRARNLKFKGETRSWKQFLEMIYEATPKIAQDGGAGLRFLVEPNASPLLQDLRGKLSKRFSGAKFYAHETLTKDNANEGSTAAFGRPLEAQLHLDKASVIVSLDADLLEAVGEHLRHAREWASKRTPNGAMNRLYVAEPALSVTGMSADHRQRMKPSEVGALARSILTELGNAGVNVPKVAVPKLPENLQKFATTIAQDLKTAGNSALVVAGERQPPYVHAIAHAINGALGAIGNTVTFTDVGLSDTVSGPAALKALCSEIDAGKVQTLIITAWNPVYSAPADLDFARRLEKVPTVIYLGTYEDETAPKAHWFIPAAHPFETWGDVRSADGTVSIIQPLTQPLFGSVSEAELMAALTGEGDLSPYELTKQYWAGRAGGADFDRTFEQWLADGIVPNTKLPELTVSVNAGGVSNLLAGAPGEGAFSGFELSFAKDYKVLDGRFANNAWMQELPDPVSKLTWDNVAYVSTATAARLNLRNARYDHETATEVDVCVLEYGGVKMEVAVLPMPGHPDDVVTLPLGYGREGAERVARGVGFNANLVRKSDKLWFDSGVTLTKADKQHDLAVTQEHWSLEHPSPRASSILISTSITDFKNNPEALKDKRGGATVGTPEGTELPPSLIPKFDYNKGDDPTGIAPIEYAWGMAVDLSKCTGCSACVLACQAENNIPVVGKTNVQKSREMHWLRIDRYFAGDENDPATVRQPMLCQQCEAAPCEYVCPVNATVHSDEGLNDMVYNRCVGTRYCSNNCPYKVRRFNFLHYTAFKSATEKMAMNPDVTVRARGVMEKCTYCVQRIERARITARIDGRMIREGELQTACQQACPTGVYTFGNLKDESQTVTKMSKDQRRYDVMAELGTRPRTAYLAHLTNPNPTLAPPAPAAGHGEAHEG